MQQSTRRLILLVGSSLVCAAGMLVAACSSDSSSSSDVVPTVEAGKKDGTSTPPPPGTTDGGDLDATTAADCSQAPKLRDNTNGFFCAFVARDAGQDAAADADAGNPQYCHNNEVCCNSGKDDQGNFGDSFCQFDPNKGNNPNTGGNACANHAGWIPDGGSTWECADKNNCPSNQVCCLFTQPGATSNVNIGKTTDKSIPASCDALQAFKQGGTRCAASCTAGSEIKLCSKTDDNCGAGTTCTPFRGLFRDLAYCK